MCFKCSDKFKGTTSWNSWDDFRVFFKEVIHIPLWLSPTASHRNLLLSWNCKLFVSCLWWFVFCAGGKCLGNQRMNLVWKHIGLKYYINKTQMQWFDDFKYNAMKHSTRVSSHFIFWSGVSFPLSFKTVLSFLSCLFVTLDVKIQNFK